MAERGTGTITVGGITTQFRAPTRPEQAAMPTQVSPEEDRLKKFYTEQYNIEAQTFIKSPMSQEQFDRGISRLQAKYKLAFNQAKMKMETDQPDPAFKQFSELDIYRNRLEQNIKDFRVMPAGKIPSFWRPKWWEKIAPEELQTLDPSKIRYNKDGSVNQSSTQGAWRKATLEEIRRYGLLSNELERVTAAQNVLLQPQRETGLMRTAITSPRIGGAIKDQTRAYLDQQTVTQRQEPEEIISRGGKQWRIVGHDTDGTPLVEEIR